MSAGFERGVYGLSCYHPLIREPKYGVNPFTGLYGICLDSDGSVVYRVRSLAPHEYELNYLDNGLPDNCQIIPCGHCVGCKLDHSREWADRMLLELQTAHSAIFVTLTYDPEHVPHSTYTDNQGLKHSNYTLRKVDLQDFFKRLRRRFDSSGDYDLPQRRIRYYAAGEYGEMTLRPHYHCIIFGLSFDDVQATPALTPLGDPVTNDLGDPYYNSRILDAVWSYGLVSCAQMTWRTCAYVARYVTKKWSSGYDSKDRNFNLYNFFCVEPEFSIMSLKPGIGSEYLDYWLSVHPDADAVDILAYSKVSVSDQSGGKSVRIPKYIKRKFRDSSNPVWQQAYADLVLRNIVASESRIALQLERTDKEYLDVLQASEDHLIGQTRILRRDKI